MGILYKKRGGCFARCGAVERFTDSSALFIDPGTIVAGKLQPDTRSPTLNSPSEYVRKLFVEITATWEIYRLLPKPEG